MGISPNLQVLRHGVLADRLRRVIYRRLVGDAEWPPVFRAPDEARLRPHPSGNVYVHLPFCETLCPHCPYNKVRFDAAQAVAYHEALLREIAEYVGRRDARQVRTLYFGGGTPTLTPETIRAVIAAFAPLLVRDAEIGVEGYPLHATPDRLAALRAMGVTHLSLGVEALNPDLLKRLGRRYGPERAMQGISDARAAGFEMIDVNLILGIPGQGAEDFTEGVARCLDAGVDQISAYPLFTFDHTPAGAPGLEDLFARADDADRLRMQRAASDLTRAAGFERSSVWSYTRAGCSPYTTVTRPDYLGFGAGAGSKAGALAAFTTFSVPAYIEASPFVTALSYRFTERQRKADWLYWRIYTTRIDREAYEAEFGVSIDRDFGAALRLLRRMGLMTRDATEDRLTETGAIWVHRIQALFSLNGIDRVWTACQAEPWPRSVAIA